MLDSWTVQRFADQALAWLLTYALHSTLLLGAAWGLTRWLRGRALAAQETIWRCALLGALLTASLQLAAGHFGHLPVAGRWSVATAGTGAPAASAVPSIASAATPAPIASRMAANSDAATAVAAEAAPAAAAAEALAPATARQAAGWGGRRALPLRSTVAASRAARPAAGLPGRVAGAVAAVPVLGWLPARPLLAAWLLGAVLLSAAYARSYLLFRRRLRYRPEVVGGGVLARLRQLVAESGLSRPVRLTCTWRLRVPVALGGRAAEVCVPPRALFGLTDEQQDAMLAHELAHLARRDSLWLPSTQLLAAAFFFQPLNWLARRRLRDLSELLSDEWAVARTGRPLSLAGCLAEVAAWSLGGPGRRRAAGLPVPGMADRPSQLAHRIRRLLDRSPGAEPATALRLVAVPMAVALLAVALAAPGFSAGPSATAAPPAPPAPEAAADGAEPVAAEVSPVAAPGEAPVAAADQAPLATATDEAAPAAPRNEAPAAVPSGAKGGAPLPGSAPAIAPSAAVGPGLPAPGLHMLAPTGPLALPTPALAPPPAVAPSTRAAPAAPRIFLLTPSGRLAAPSPALAPLAAAPPSAGAGPDAAGLRLFVLAPTPRPAPPSAAAPLSGMPPAAGGLPAAAPRLLLLSPRGAMALASPGSAPLAAMPLGGPGLSGMRPMLLAARIPAAAGGGAAPAPTPSPEAEEGPDAAPAIAPPAPGAAGAGGSAAGMRGARSLEEESERLAAAAAQMEQLDKLTFLSKEQIAAITAAAARISGEFDARMREEMKGLDLQIAAAQAMQWKLSQQDLARIDAELSAAAARIHPSPKDIADLEAQLRKLSTSSMRPSQADIKRIEAEVKRELKRLPDLGISPADAARLREDVERVVKASVAALPPPLSDADRDRLLADAHRLADQTRLDPAQLEALRDLQRRHQDLSRLIDLQRRQLDSLRTEIEDQARGLRDLADRESQAHRVRPSRPSPDARPKLAPHAPAPPASPGTPAPPPAAPPAPAPSASHAPPAPAAAPPAPPPGR